MMMVSIRVDGALKSDALSEITIIHIILQKRKRFTSMIIEIIIKRLLHSVILHNLAMISYK